MTFSFTMISHLDCWNSFVLFCNFRYVICLQQITIHSGKDQTEKKYFYFWLMFKKKIYVT